MAAAQLSDEQVAEFKEAFSLFGEFRTSGRLCWQRGWLGLRPGAAGSKTNSGVHDPFGRCLTSPCPSSLIMQTRTVSKRATVALTDSRPAGGPDRVARSAWAGCGGPRACSCGWMKCPAPLPHPAAAPCSIPAACRRCELLLVVFREGRLEFAFLQ